MARGVNKAILVGHLGQDPEVKQLPSGSSVTNITVATADSWTDSQGQRQERTEWHRVVMFNKLAEIAGQYLRKGSQVYIEGSIQTRKWEKDGVPRYSTEIIARNMQMLGSKGASGGGEYSQQPPAQQNNTYQPPQASAHSAHSAPPSSPQNAPEPDFSDLDDDLPF